jgi:hypothetical protein
MSLADLELLWENHSTAIIAALLLALVGRAAVKGRANLRRFAEHQAERRAVAASLGLAAPGTDVTRGPASALAAMVVDVPERFGRFPRFEGYPRARLLFEGERHGFGLCVLAHRPTSEYGENDPTTTCALFSSPAIDVPEFQLRPAVGKLSPEVEAALDFVGKGFAKVFGAPDPEIAFPARPRFGELYTLTTTFTVRIHDAFQPRVLEFFEARPGWTVEGVAGRLLVYRRDVEESDARMGDFLREATAVAEVFRKPV